MFNIEKVFIYIIVPNGDGEAIGVAVCDKPAGRYVILWNRTG